MHVHKHTHMHHKGKLRQLLGIQHKQPHQMCRQTDDYLHDKDLKYSPQNVFPWSSSTTFHVYLQSKRAGFDIKAIFQRPERRRLWQHICQDWAPSFFRLGGGGEQRGHIVVFPAENHLMLSRFTLTHSLSLHCSRLWYMCICTQKYTVHLLNSQTHRDKDRPTRTHKIKKGVDFSWT